MLSRKQIINLNFIIMEKNEKLKALAAVAEGFGLTAEEAAAYFGKISVCSDKTEEVSVQSEEAVLPDVVCPGMYYYSDRTISAEVIPEKQISGVVGWVDESGRHGLVLGLQEAELPWSSVYLKPGTFKKSGKENTRLILEAARRQNKKAAAAEWCAAYAFDGVRVGEAFLPSKDELVKIFRNLDSVQEALEEIKQPQLEEYDWYRSSSEYYTSGNAWVVRPSDGYMDDYGKDNDYRVRCVLAF